MAASSSGRRRARARLRGAKRAAALALQPGARRADPHPTPRRAYACVAAICRSGGDIRARDRARLAAPRGVHHPADGPGLTRAAGGHGARGIRPGGAPPGRGDRQRRTPLGGLAAPKLGPLGYELVGGRLLSGLQGPVAQFMYQDARGQRLTLYVSRQRGEPRDTAFRFSQEDRVSVFYWVDGNYGYALSGEIRRDLLLQVAEVVYKQLNP